MSVFNTLIRNVWAFDFIGENTYCCTSTTYNYKYMKTKKRIYGTCHDDIGVIEDLG